MKKLAVIVIVCLGLVACDSGKKNNRVGDKIAGEKVAGWYYFHMMNGNYDSIPKLLSADYFNANAKLELKQKIKNRNEELGAIKSFTLLDWEGFKGDHKNSEYTFVYDVNYERGNGVETLNLERKDHKTYITKIEFDSK